MKDHLKNAGILFGLIIIQKTLIWLIAITSYDVTPDLVLVGLVYIGIRNGKIYGTLSGFAAGLVIDSVSFSFLGLMALSKATAGFVSGFFCTDENKIERYLNTWVFIIIVLFCSLVNNFIYYSFYFQGSTLPFSDMLIRYVVPTAVYTSIFGIVPIIIEKRRRSR